MPVADRVRKLFRAECVFCVIRILVIFCAGYFFVIFHGVAFHLTPWSQAFVNSILKFSYGTSGQQEITVLLFREENLKELHVDYPVPYRLHAQILEALARYQPKAVFVDFVFVASRAEKAEDVKALTDSLCRLEASGAAVFLAKPLSGPEAPETETRLFRCAAPASPTIGEPYGVSGVLEYPNGAGNQDNFIPSAAFAMAQRLKGGFDPAREEPLEIIWGKGVAPLNRKWMDCNEPGPLQSISRILREGPLATKLVCPYSRTITVSHLLNSIGDPDVQDAVAGKAIFYGAGFYLSGDEVQSPVYARMPGVYLHAMAYDNLVEFGENYKLAERHSLAAQAVDMVLLLAVAAALVKWRRGDHHDRKAGDSSYWNDVARALGWAAATVVAPCIITLVWGLDAGLLGFLSFYILYRIFGVKDMVFIVFFSLMMAMVILDFRMLDIGPRNILGFLFFFEIARHVQHWLQSQALRHANRVPCPPGPDAPLFQRAIDFLLRMYLPKSDSVSLKEDKNASASASSGMH